MYILSQCKIYTESTSPTQDSAALNDHVYIWNVGQDIITEVYDCYYSDHDVVYCGVHA